VPSRNCKWRLTQPQSSTNVIITLGFFENVLVARAVVPGPNEQQTNPAATNINVVPVKCGGAAFPSLIMRA